MSVDTSSLQRARLVYKQAEIEAALQGEAERIADRHPTGEGLLLIAVLKGGSRTAEELSQALSARGVHGQSDYIRVSTYRSGQMAEPRIVTSPSIPLQGKHVYVIDEIADSGQTLRKIKDEFTPLGLASLSFLTLIVRGDSLRGMENFRALFEFDGEEWLVGWGLDEHEDGRWLNDIHGIPPHAQVFIQNGVVYYIPRE